MKYGFPQSKPWSPRYHTVESLGSEDESWEKPISYEAVFFLVFSYKTMQSLCVTSKILAISS